MERVPPNTTRSIQSKAMPTHQTNNRRNTHLPLFTAPCAYSRTTRFLIRCCTIDRARTIVLVVCVFCMCSSIPFSPDSITLWVSTRRTTSTQAKSQDAAGSREIYGVRYDQHRMIARKMRMRFKWIDSHPDTQTKKQNKTRRVDGCCIKTGFINLKLPRIGICKVL